MWRLYHFPLCPFSRKLRLALAEKGDPVELRWKGVAAGKFNIDKEAVKTSFDKGGAASSQSTEWSVEHMSGPWGPLSLRGVCDNDM